jgi:hypothetical protein
MRGVTFCHDGSLRVTYADLRIDLHLLLKRWRNQENKTIKKVSSKAEAAQGSSWQKPPLQAGCKAYMRSDDS